MKLEITNFFSPLVGTQAVSNIVKSNEISSRFGLTLSYVDAVELVETYTRALKGTGRIEFGGRTIEKIIRVFCDSPHLIQENYAESLHDLTEMFYYYKNETLDMISDDELIEFMKTSFDGTCQGSLALLSGRELANMARNLRYGYPVDHWENTGDEE